MNTSCLRLCSTSWGYPPNPFFSEILDLHSLAPWFLSTPRSLSFIFIRNDHGNSSVAFSLGFLPIDSWEPQDLFDVQSTWVPLIQADGTLPSIVFFKTFWAFHLTEYSLLDSTKATPTIVFFFSRLIHCNLALGFCHALKILFSLAEKIY